MIIPSILPTGKVSLRYQINIRILFSSMVILLLGASLAIWQARKAVDAEVDSSIKLAIQLMNIGLANTAHTAFAESDWLTRFNVLEETRHLNIQIKNTAGKIITTLNRKQQTPLENIPPQWFINLVVSEYPQAEHRISSTKGKQLTLLIQANPLDEITEVWQESLIFFFTIFLLVLITFITVNLAFNKSLQAIETIVENLKFIETGHYRQKLPEFTTREYDSIAAAINHMTEVLDQTQEKNRKLTQHSLEIQEDERQRLAQELHDELGQSVTAIKVMAVTAQQKSSETQAISASIINICDHLMSVLRSLMQQLHPLILTELGLKAALEDMCDHWMERNPELALSLRCSDWVEQLEQKISIQIFRVIQECLTNIIRHADASVAHIQIDVSDRQQTLLLQVTDNGRGCNLKSLTSGFGLLGMRERVKSLGGEFYADSQEHQGMTIRARIPLHHG